MKGPAKFLIISLLFIVPVITFGKVNINTASVDEFVAADLYRITADQATKVIKYREANGPFIAIEDIMKVSGIKEATFAKIKDSITVGGEILLDSGPGLTSNNLLASPNPNSGGSSAHSSPTGLSDLVEEEVGLSVSAGRDRVVATGSRILFKATARGLKNGGNGADFYWNFGDGEAARGQGLYHTYRYPGTYNVVLTLNQAGEEAVSRLKVRVLDPKVELKSKVVRGGEPVIEVKNLAGEEVNLGEWSLVSSREKFVLPADTVIAPGSSLVLPLATDGQINLIAPSGQSFAQSYQFANNSDWQSLRVGLVRAAAQNNQEQSAGISLVELPAIISLGQSGPLTIATSSSVELPAKKSWWSRFISFIF